MSNDPSSGGDVPDEVWAWLADLADERGLTQRELVERLLSGDGVDVSAGPGGDVGELAERVETVEESVSALEDALDDRIQDVRERVIQVKREADDKAPRDHDHADLQESLLHAGENLEALGNDLVDLDAHVDRLGEQVDAVDDRMSRGFSNYEDVLEYLMEVTDDLNEKVDTLARAIVEVRERTERLETADLRRAGADRLREAAGRHGITQASCEACKETVQLGLLTAPRCPHCEEPFSQLEPGGRFFRPSVLRTGRRPALEGEVDREATDIDDIVGDEADAPPEVGVETTTPSHVEADATTSEQGTAVGADGGATADDGSPPDGVERAVSERETADDADEAGEGDAATAGHRRHDTAAAGGAADLAVDEVSGIGPAYAERLGAAGVETVGALALSDPERLAERTDVARGRVDTWIERARGMIEDD